jgi:hypothetical protein
MNARRSALITSAWVAQLDHRLLASRGSALKMINDADVNQLQRGFQPHCAPRPPSRLRADAPPSISTRRGRGCSRSPQGRRARCTIRLPQCSSTMSPLARWCSISGSGRNHRAPARSSVRSSRQSSARWKRWARNLRRPRSHAKRRRTAIPRDISKGESQFAPHEFEHVWNSVLKENPMT